MSARGVSAVITSGVSLFSLRRMVGALVKPFGEAASSGVAGGGPSWTVPWEAISIYNPRAGLYNLRMSHWRETHQHTSVHPT